MTLSSDQFASGGLDAMLIVYSLLDDHPASAVCESFIREHYECRAFDIAVPNPENPIILKILVQTIIQTKETAIVEHKS